MLAVGQDGFSINGRISPAWPQKVKVSLSKTFNPKLLVVEASFVNGSSAVISHQSNSCVNV